MKKQVAVIFGGKSSEHEVSCHSVLNVIKGFSPEKYEIHLIGITKEGHWIYVPDATAIEDGSWYNYEELAEELAGQKQEAAARRTLVLETKYGAKIYPLDELLHLYLTEGEHKTDILEHLKEEAL